MEDKIKFIIIALVGVLVLSIYVNLQTYNSKRVIERQRDEAKQENEVFRKKIEEKVNANQRLEQEARTLTTDINKLRFDTEKISSENQERQKKYELLVKERDGLADKLKAEREKPKEEAKKEFQEPATQQDAYWGRLLRSKAELEAQLERIRNESKTIQLENEHLQKEKSALELELTSLAHEREDLKKELTYHQQSIDSVAAELAREKNAGRQYQDSLKFVKTENMILKRQVKTLSEYKISLEKKLAKLQEEKVNSERRFNEMAALLEDKVSRLGEIKDKIETIRSTGEAGVEEKPVELPPIIVHSQEIPETAPRRAPATERPLMGSILAIDKDNNFAVIDLGEDSGIKTGEIFQVYRYDKKIATLEVIEVRNKISACDIKKESLPIAVGDKIIQ